MDLVLTVDLSSGEIWKMEWKSCFWWLLKRGLFNYIPEKLAQNELSFRNLHWISY